MKVLNIVIAKVWGGGEQYVYDTAKALAKQGVEVHIAVDSSCKEMQERFSQVARVRCFNLHSLAGFTSLSSLCSYIKEQQINVINCHSGHAMALCTVLKLLTNARLVCFKHNAIKAKLDFYHDWQRKHTDAFVCVSKLVYELQTQGLAECDKSKFYLVYNGIDTEKYDKMLAEQEPEIDNRYFTVGYAGRLARDKGIDVLLMAMAKLVARQSNIRLLLAGSDEKGYKAELETLVKAKNLQERIAFLGQVEIMPTFYNKLDVFVLPSVVKEAFGLTICEAMYCGVPVIATDSGAQREIISSEELGCIVPSKDPDALAAAIADVALDNNIEMRTSLAKARVKNMFSANKCAAILIDIYKDLN